MVVKAMRCIRWREKRESDFISSSFHALLQVEFHLS